jgi:hypothetical protein
MVTGAARADPHPEHHAVVVALCFTRHCGAENLHALRRALSYLRR